MCLDANVNSPVAPIFAAVLLRFSFTLLAGTQNLKKSIFLAAACTCPIFLVNFLDLVHALLSVGCKLAPQLAKVYICVYMVVLLRSANDGCNSCQKEPDLLLFQNTLNRTSPVVSDTNMLDGPIGLSTAGQSNAP